VSDHGAIEAANAQFYRAFETLDIHENVEVVTASELAWVTCTEKILSEVRGRVTVTSVLATNVVERETDGWRLDHVGGQH